MLAVVGCCRPGLGTKEGFGADALAAHVRSRQASYGEGWTVLSVPPFVVIGDGLPNEVRLDAEEVVAVAAKKLRTLYFERAPAVIVDVVMLRDEASYDRVAGSSFSAPTTPYGFYAPCREAIYVNMALGNGTLVHEMVHAFMDANFPECPVWFNEGLGSLYEQPDLTSDPMRGRPNWRLPRLQDAIARRRTMPIEELLALGSSEFYAEKRSGLAYAMARYLCYHLQERGLLQTFFRRFVANHDADPTGVETLKAVLGETDLRKIQREWESATLAIAYP